MSKKEHILKWIHNISENKNELNGFAICPFASKSKYEIIECPAKNIKIIDNLDVIIYIIEDDFDLKEIQKWVEYYNLRYKDWKFFEDCGKYDTYINGIQTNNEIYNLILGQPKKKLRMFRENLAKSSYYDLWDKNYLKEILEDDYDIIEHGIGTP